MIFIKDLTKNYEDFEALNISYLQIKEGSLFGLVGVNGSSKSTLLRTMAGVYKPNHGNVFVDDQIIYENEEIKKDILFIPDDPLSSYSLSLNSLYDYYHTFYNLSKENFYHYLDLFSLPHQGILGKFSKGMRRRVYLAIALAIAPRILLLDEAFDGLDPLGKNIFKQEILKLSESKEITIVISSHSLRELEDICDSYCMLDKGRIISQSDESLQEQDLYKFVVAFPSTFDFDQIQNDFIKQRKCTAKIGTFICEGKEEEIEKFFKSFNPSVIDKGELTFEELFIYKNEMEGK
ncbi:MAG: ATP-binding cassette domain-containing protein [Bacilli bacterium]